MRRAFTIALLLITSACNAGPLLDDYLNYARLGERCAGGSAEVTAKADNPIGQTFTAVPGTSEIYRIGVQANTDAKSWGEGETVTLTLYDSPAKGKTLGTYSIGSDTCRVQPGKISGERVLLFPLRAKLSGETSLYFELSVTGGDGEVRFRSVPSDGYMGGDGYDAGRKQPWDLCFETHVKPTADRTANLKSMWERFNLGLPELSSVRDAVAAGNYDKAEEEMVKHFHLRFDLYESGKDVLNPVIDPDFDLTRADKLISGRVWTEDDKGNVTGDMPWRKESYWAPEYEGIGKTFQPNIYTWGIQKFLAAAYSATADAKYARAAIDLRTQWIIDNCPSPRITGIDAPHEVWNELAAANRAPGNLPYVYARLYNFPGWTTDEKMIYFLSWYDSAEYLFQSDVGGNWGFQTGAACYEFGRDFPEFRRNREFVDWGSRRICDLTMECVRGDGTEYEAAIKYHSMCARRLKGLIEDNTRGKVQLDGSLVPKLMKLLEGMYEHMMYTLQPDNHVVMCGDSWWENYSEELAEVGRMVNRPDFVWVATQGKEGVPPKQTSKVFPDAGYFIMRSDFGGDKPYSDARQLFTHNGGFVGGHGHPDLLSVNLYAFGKTLIVDPGQYDFTPPQGIDPYWRSTIHSMLVADDADCERSPGVTGFVSSAGFDYFDGDHSGYAKQGAEKVRRRIVFVKPDYWIVDDSATCTSEHQWDQVWNFAGKDVKIDPVTKVAEIPGLIVYPLSIECEVARRPGVVKMAGDGYSDTSILSYRTQTAGPRYTTVLYPYKDARPALTVSAVKPDTKASDLVTAVKITHDKSVDVIAWGDPGQGAVTYAHGKHVLDGDALVVRTSDGQAVKAFSWYNARCAVFESRELARADNPVAVLDVAYEPTGVRIEARESDPTLVVWIGDAKSVTVNGRKLDNAKPDKGYIKPFPSGKRAIVVDDNSPGFRRATNSQEWETLSDPDAYAWGYSAHETDPGRHESASYSASIPAKGKYRLEVFVPKTTRARSDAVQYTVHTAKGDVSRMLDQTDITGWTDLGSFGFEAGKREFLTVTNLTAVDGVYPIFDAVRLVAE